MNIKKYKEYIKIKESINNEDSVQNLGLSNDVKNEMKLSDLEKKHGKITLQNI